MLLELLEKISDDELAEVYVGRLIASDGPSLVTARRLHRQLLETPAVIQGLEEASASLAGLVDDHLVHHLGYARVQGEHYWVSERPNGFDLGVVLQRLATREVHLQPLQALHIGQDFLQGLMALHARGLVHGGLGPGHVLVGYDGRARLDGAGYETSLLSVKEIKQKARRGRARHLAPEVFQGREPTVQSDVFSAAAILYTLLTGRPPLGEEDHGGAGMSVRHTSIQPPSKLDRSLPYSCDAVFIKALNTSAKGRHDSAAALFNAVKRLRASMLKGPDEGRKSVAEFVTGLFPNEAIVAGQPGTLKRPALSAGVELAGLRPRPVGGPLGDEEDTPPEGAVPTAVAEAEARAEQASPPRAAVDRPDPDAVARVEAWESAFGSFGTSQSAKPPPLPGQADRDARGARPPTGPSDSIVVDWSGLDDRDAVGVAAPLDKAETPQVAISAARIVPVPKKITERGTLEKAKTPVVIREPLDPEEDEDGYHPGAKTQPDMRFQPPPEEPGPPARRRRPVVLAAIVLLAAAAVVGLLLLFDVFSPAPGEPDPQSRSTAVGFLTVETDRRLKVTLDGEVLPGTQPVKNKLIRAGQHRLILDTPEGERLMDEVITIEPGEKKNIRLVVAAAPDASVPGADQADETAPPPKRPGVRKKRTRKRRPKRRRRTRSTR